MPDSVTVQTVLLYIPASHSAVGTRRRKQKSDIHGCFLLQNKSVLFTGLL